MTNAIVFTEIINGSPKYQLALRDLSNITICLFLHFSAPNLNSPSPSRSKTGADLFGTKKINASSFAKIRGNPKDAGSLKHPDWRLTVGGRRLHAPRNLDPPGDPSEVVRVMNLVDRFHGLGRDLASRKRLIRHRKDKVEEKGRRKIDRTTEDLP